MRAGASIAGEPLLTAEQVASFLQCSKRHVWHLRDRGLLPDVRVGGLVRFAPAAVRDLLARGVTHEPTTTGDSAADE